MNTIVNFEIAQLLKDKGFDETIKSYDKEGKLITVSITIRRFKPEKVYYPAPTITEVIMWLYEKYGIWIGVGSLRIGEWHFNYKHINTNESLQYAKESGFKHNSPTEAYLEAILYTLNNLI
jgi:hypothetical protein